MNINHIPKELQNLRQWVCWRLEPDKKTERTTKVPYNPHTGFKASPSNPDTWGTLEEALFCAEKYLFSGVGFVFTKDTGIVGIDLDHCLVDGKPNAVAADILSRLPPTYIEISPSGTGLHIFLKGKLSKGGNRNSKHGVEVYASARYFTITGNPFENSVDKIAEDNGVIEYIHEKYITIQRKTKPKSTAYQGGASLSDDDILSLAQSSKDSTDFTKLWTGDWQDKFKSQSEADFALCRKLAFWTGRDEAQIDRLFRKSALFREKWDNRHSAGGATYGEQTITNACAITAQIYSPPAPKQLAEIFEQGGAYYRRRGDKIYRITNFIVEPIEMITADEEAQLTCNLISDIGETLKMTFLTSDFATTVRFEGILCKNTIAVSFLGGESDLKLFKIFLYSLPWKKQRGVRALGIYPRKKTLVFVDTNGAVGSGGKAVAGIIQMSRYKNLESNILSAPLIDSSGLYQLAKHILTYNEPAKTIPILAWCAACFIKPHLRRIGVKFPHLFLIGEAGSGKSNTLERIVMPIFSIPKVKAASQVTAFALMKESNSSNIFPQAFDEFKPSKLDKLRINALYNHFRNSYDGHEGLRGQADQTIATYDLLAPIVVAGEESADESAIRERSVELLFSKKDIKDPKYRESFVWISANMNLLSSLGRSILDRALSTIPTEVKVWFSEAKDFFSPELPLRVLDNLRCLYCGLCLLKKLCDSLSVPWTEAFPYGKEACLKYMEFGAKEYLLDGGTNNKSVVEQTFEIMSRMKLKVGDDYAFENNNDILCIWLHGVYDRYTRYRRDCAIVGDVLTYAQFRKQLEHSEFFIDKNKPKRMGEDIRKVWVLSFSGLSKRCDVSGFIKEAAEHNI